MTVCLSAFSKDKRLSELSEAVQHCNLCPRLCSRNKILSSANGNADSRILFIAEAPGRLGADRTQIPLFGDKTGDNFEALLEVAGWHREDVFITNAVLCNPRDPSGNNATPTHEEIRHCAPYLEMTINLVQPDVVVAMGATALLALSNIAPHSVVLSKDVGKILPWFNRAMVSLYHPAPRAMVHRSLAQQQADITKLAQSVAPDTGLQCEPVNKDGGKANEVFIPSAFEQVIYAIIQYLGQVSYFKLTKLLYLVDLRALERTSHTITREIYIRQKEGPWPPSLWDNVERLDGREILVRRSGQNQYLGLGPAPRFDLTLDDSTLEVIIDVLQRYGEYDNSMIKSAAYHTAPMRYVLRQERTGKSLMNKPIIYRDRTIDQL